MIPSNTKNRAVALGFFDGLHIAHRAVLEATLAQKEEGLTPSVLLFDEHPYTVLTGKRIARLMTNEDRRNALINMGFELLDVSFREIRGLPPADFIRSLLKETCRCAFVSCGYNYTFGAGGQGTAETLTRLCEENGMRAAVCERVQLDGMDVCSSAIRDALRRGDVITANRMLGAPFSFASPVFHGDRRGVRLGYPTANQHLPEGLIVPKAGVYAAMAQTENGKTYPAVTNIGVRPTFGGDDVRSETHLLGFSGDLYGQTLRVFLHAFLREERKFPSFEALRAQIEADAAAAQTLLGTDGSRQ